jgi:exopolysaccharide production protein ExoF
MPKELQDQPEAKALAASEMASDDIAQEAADAAASGARRSAGLLQSEVDSLAKKTETQTRQLELATADRDKVEDLAEKGLVLSARKMAAEQRAADLEATLLDIDTNSLKAKQDISKANQDEITLRNDWDAQLAQEQQSTDAQLDELNLKLQTSNSLMSEALTQSTDAARFDSSSGAASIAYSIIREVDGTAEGNPGAGEYRTAARRPDQGHRRTGHEVTRQHAYRKVGAHPARRECGLCRSRRGAIAVSASPTRSSSGRCRSCFIMRSGCR